jgi:ubiquinone/menaquinone biosynthesis C-methylase UbiE
VSDTTTNGGEEGRQGPDDGSMTPDSHVNEWARIDDASGQTQGWIINYLDDVAAHPDARRVRTAGFEMFMPTEGERLLDAGCGLGEVARQLGERVGPRGSVTAVDLSEKAIAVAQSRYAGGPVTYTVGDVTALDFPDDSFDGARCERVLQHVPDSDAAIKELARVTRPGGRICVIDTDWSSSTGDGFEYLSEVMGGFFPDEVDQAAGRRIRSRMVKAGLRETSVLPVTLHFTSLAEAAVGIPFLNRTKARDRLPEELFNRFFSSVDQSVSRGDFLFALTMWVCLGRVTPE